MQLKHPGASSEPKPDPDCQITPPATVGASDFSRLRGFSRLSMWRNRLLERLHHEVIRQLSIVSNCTAAPLRETKTHGFASLALRTQTLVGIGKVSR